jgi:hypothetical protein
LDEAFDELLGLLNIREEHDGGDDEDDDGLLVVEASPKICSFLL